jgi:hypothetical protein
MKRKRPVKPRTSTQSDATPEQAPTPVSAEERLEEALRANATLVELLKAVSANLDSLRLAILRSIG